MKIEIEISEDKIIKLESIVKHLQTSNEEYIEFLVKKDLEDNIYLNYDYVYDKRKKVLMNNNELITFNNMESKLFEFLIIKVGEFASNEDIMENVIFEKSMSVFAIRNLIKSLRDKTNKKLILTKNNIGYKLNLLG